MQKSLDRNCFQSHYVIVWAQRNALPFAQLPVIRTIRLEMLFHSLQSPAAAATALPAWRANKFVLDCHEIWSLRMRTGRIYLYLSPLCFAFFIVRTADNSNAHIILSQLYCSAANSFRAEASASIKRWNNNSYERNKFLCLETNTSIYVFPIRYCGLRPLLSLAVARRGLRGRETTTENMKIGRELNLISC